MNIMYSSCDTKYFNYVLNMYKTFKEHNTNTPMYFGNIDCTEAQLSLLKDLNVRIRQVDTTILKDNKLSLNFVDWLIYTSMGDVKYDKVLWVDADTTILQNIEHLFDHKETFVGHSGRNKEGAILSENGKVRFAGGTWVGTKAFVQLLYEYVQNLRNLNVESQTLTRFIIEKGITFYMLDPSEYNFSRELIDKAERDEEGKVFYKVYPKTAGFSIKSDGSRGKL